MSGVIQGGWGYVAGAYGITAGVLLLYVVWLYTRLRTSGRSP